MWRSRRTVMLSGLLLLLCGCGVEKRDLGAGPPSSPPNGPADPRQAHYETNVYEINEGGRMFRWFGCDQCHQDAAEGYLNLADHRWRQGGTTADIYRAIVDGAPGMPAYRQRIAAQQTWQIAGFVHNLSATPPNMRRRNVLAQQGEPSGGAWLGALR